MGCVCVARGVGCGGGAGRGQVLQLQGGIGEGGGRWRTPRPHHAARGQHHHGAAQRLSARLAQGQGRQVSPYVLRSWCRLPPPHATPPHLRERTRQTLCGGITTYFTPG